MLQCIIHRVVTTITTFLFQCFFFWLSLETHSTWLRLGKDWFNTERVGTQHIYLNPTTYGTYLVNLDFGVRVLNFIHPPSSIISFWYYLKVFHPIVKKLQVCTCATPQHVLQYNVSFAHVNPLQHCSSGCDATSHWDCTVHLTAEKQKKAKESIVYMLRKTLCSHTSSLRLCVAVAQAVEQVVH